tara:strand:+ start:3076 stop:3294 length:219 start_codon:yes stop_codon:yes gene_type:complete
MTGSFITGTKIVYSTLVMLNFESMEECTKYHNQIHGNDETKCFISYVDTYDIPPLPLDRPKLEVFYGDEPNE